MDRHLISSILFLLIIGLLESAYGISGYKWVSLKSGEALPENIQPVYGSTDRYIGRARHFDEILPAKITENGLALISSCKKEISKDQFEILTVSDGCEWKSFSEYDDIDENAVRVGTAWNGEPIFIRTSANGNYYDYNNDNHLVYIYLSKMLRNEWDTKTKDYVNDNYADMQYLSCDINTKWIDTLASKLPNNTVSGGKSEDDNDIFVARLKRDCDVVTGQVVPEMGTATAFLNDNRPIETAYCQVLVGEPNEYIWVAASDGQIPDYAVAQGKKVDELSYIARFNQTIGHLTHSEALQQQLDYEILVKNQL